MGYIERSLSPGEVMRAQVKVHWGVYVPAFGLAAGALAAAALTGAGELAALMAKADFPVVSFGWLPAIVLGASAVSSGVKALIYALTTEMAVTNKKVIGKWGLISRNTMEQRLSKVESITVDQGVLGRLFNYGTVLVRGTGSTATPIRYIENPTRFRRSIEEAIEALEAVQGVQSVRNADA